MAATKRQPDAPPAGRKQAPTALNSADPRRNFTLSVGERIRAITIGAPAWSIRKRKIEDDADRLVDELVELHDTLLVKGRPTGEIFLALERAASAFDLSKLNANVELHNRYYPIEANLAMNQDGYLVHGRPWRPEELYTPARLVDLARELLAERELQENA